MGSGFGASTGREPQSSSCSGGNDAGRFECNICFDLAQDPIVTLCGHLFCWPCLDKCLHLHAHSPECPVCKAVVEEEKLIPLYGRGTTPADPRSRSAPAAHIPDCPSGQSPATAPQPDPNQYPHANPWLMGGPLFNFLLRGFVDANGPAAVCGYANAFHGAHARMSQRQQADFYMKVLLFVVCSLVITSLICF